ncbi:hypothetical protein [Achromobacter phage Motura]|uniref:Uncharacterized protein n=1 Tax=Achromobacter phage Motura TaxID=2591403 RepID=A0A514CT83_9CAUD|nr:hypothetical protein H1O15_gp278 [Achromobacter phage Motura]QDH83683.1 hypothetical protein [Achromobacter phage Motura]
MNDLQKKAQKYKTLFKFGTLGVILFVLAPILYTVLQATVAAIALAVIGGTTWMLTPYLSTKFANMRLKLVKEAAKENPIETAQLELQRRRAELQERKAAIEKWGGYVQGYILKAKEQVDKYPHKKQEYLERIQGMQALHQRRAEQWRETRAALEVYAAQVQEKIDEYEMAKEELKVRGMVDGMDEADLFAQIKMDEAMKEMTSTVGMAFSSLESITHDMDYDHEKGKKLIANSPTQSLNNLEVIDVEAVLK